MRLYRKVALGVFDQKRVKTPAYFFRDEILKDKGAGKLSGPVNPEVKKDYRVVLFDKSQGLSVGSGYQAGLYKFICLTQRI